MPSSMDSGSTLPTQDVVDGYFSEPEETAEPAGWGKLIPVGRGFELIGSYTQIVNTVDVFVCFGSSHSSCIVYYI